MRVGLIIHPTALRTVHEGSDAQAEPIYSYEKATKVSIRDDIKVAYIQFKI